jgi:predicted transcriptional regulator
MSTTSIRMDADLKERIAAVAQRAGQTPHAFIVEAIERTVEQAELEDEFHRVADRRWAKVLATGKTVPWAAAKTYLEARAVAKRTRKPVARKLG